MASLYGACSNAHYEETCLMNVIIWPGKHSEHTDIIKKINKIACEY